MYNEEYGESCFRTCRHYPLHALDAAHQLQQKLQHLPQSPPAEPVAHNGQLRQACHVSLLYLYTHQGCVLDIRPRIILVESNCAVTEVSTTKDVASAMQDALLCHEAEWPTCASSSVPPIMHQSFVDVSAPSCQHCWIACCTSGNWAARLPSKDSKATCINWVC